MAASTTSSLTLSSTSVTTRGLFFVFEPHPDVDHLTLHDILNGKYRRHLKMTLEEMKVDERIYTGEGNGEEHISKDAVDNIREFFISKIVSLNSISESVKVRSVLEDQVSLMYGMKDDCFDFEETKDFDGFNKRVLLSSTSISVKCGHQSMIRSIGIIGV